MYGMWNCKVETPFGAEEYKLSIRHDGATVHHHTGDVEMDIYSYSDNKFFFQKKLDFPIQCRLLIDGNYENQKINGTVQIDTYLKVLFSGDAQ
jgi:hypothetical protein